MKNQKLIALILASTMVAGSSMMAIAADQTGNTTSTGTLIPHLDREIIDVTLPTNTTTVFNYNIDPERIINDANKLVDGSTVTNVTPNENGVYFANAGTAAVAGTVSSSIAADTNKDYQVTVSDLATNATYTYDGSAWKDADGNAATVTITVKASDGTTAGTLANGDTVTVSGAVAAGSGSYSNSSDPVKFEGKNSVDVDVTVAATVAAGSNDIVLVEDEEALAAATTPALLMTMKVGANSKAIIPAGTSAKTKIAGVADNFEVTVDSSNNYKYAAKSSPVKAWDATSLQLVGKTNQKDVSDATLTVPTITLTWTITKADPAAYGTWSGSELWLGKDANTGFSTTGLTVEVSEDATIFNALASSKYNTNDDGWVSISWDNIVEGLGDEPTGAFYVRITEGTTKYIFTNE